MTLPQPLTERLTLLRGARTQADTAAAVGVSQKTWSDYECGKCLPDLTTLEKFAIHVGISAKECGALLDARNRAAGERNVARRMARAQRGQS